MTLSALKKYLRFCFNSTVWRNEGDFRVSVHLDLDRMVVAARQAKETMKAQRLGAVWYCIRLNPTT